jgi:hypothetical protein
MRRLLLRSPKFNGWDTRIDVLFQNVTAMKVVTLFRGLTVSLADPEQAVAIVDELRMLPEGSQKMFMLTGGSPQGYVLAGLCAHLEDSGEFNDPSELWAEPPWGRGIAKPAAQDTERS